MKVQNGKQSYVNKIQTRRNQVSFQATPVQILNKLDTARLCPGKKAFLGSIADFFGGLQSKIAEVADNSIEYVYTLGKKNVIPEQLKELEVGGMTLQKMDDALNTNPFKCSPKATCGCGNGMTRGDLAKRLLEFIGAENPDVITISAKRGV